MRLFIAICLPDKIREMIGKSMQSLIASFPQISWTEKENLHLTLKFLGSVNDLQNVRNGARQSCTKAESFQLSFTQLGYFSKEQLVIFLGITSSPGLNFLLEEVETQMARFGFPKQKRSYFPHITLGRGKRLSRDLSANLKEAVRRSSPLTIPSFRVKQITLMHSHLTRHGSIYTPLEHFPLLGK